MQQKVVSSLNRRQLRYSTFNGSLEFATAINALIHVALPCGATGVPMTTYAINQRPTPCTPYNLLRIMSLRNIITHRCVPYTRHISAIIAIRRTTPEVATCSNKPFVRLTMSCAKRPAAPLSSTIPNNHRGYSFSMESLIHQVCMSDSPTLIVLNSF